MQKSKLISSSIALLMFLSIVSVTSQSSGDYTLGSGEYIVSWASSSDISEFSSDLVWDVQASIRGIGVSKPIDDSFPIRDGSIIKADPYALNLDNRSVVFNATTDDLVYYVTDTSPMNITIDNSEFSIDAVEFMTIIAPAWINNGTKSMNTFEFLAEGGDIGALLGGNASATIENGKANVTTAEGYLVYDLMTGVLIEAALTDNAFGLVTSIRLRVSESTTPNWADILSVGETLTLGVDDDKFLSELSVVDNGSTTIELEVLSVPDFIPFTTEMVSQSVISPGNLTASSAGFNIDFNSVFKFTVNNEVVDSNEYLGYIMLLKSPLATLSTTDFDSFTRQVSRQVNQGSSLELSFTKTDDGMEVKYQKLDANISSLVILYANNGDLFSILINLEDGTVYQAVGIITIRDAIEESASDINALPINPFFALMSLLALPVIMRRREI